MIAFLQRFNVGPRLGAAFGIVILLSGLLITAGITAMADARKQLDYLVQDRMVRMGLGNQMLDSNSSTLIALSLYAMVTSEKTTNDATATMAAEKKRYDELRATLYKMPSSPEGLKIREEIDARSAKSLAINAKVIELSGKTGTLEAQTMLGEQARPANMAWQAELRKLVARQDMLGKKSYADAVKAMERGKLLLILGGLGVVFISTLLAWTITRSLTQPLSRATKAAEAIAKGDVNNDVETTANDEAGRLLRAMKAMQSQLRALLSAQSEMAKQHDEGAISFRMRANAFPGAFGQMAQDTNALVSSHVEVQTNLARIMGRYAIGDLSEDMIRLPGEKALLTQTMDEVKSNLSAMNVEIKQLALAAANGDFTARGDAERFQYDFYVMVDSLNQLMATADANLNSLSGLLQSIAAGDLTVRMTGEFKGVFAQMRDDANATAAQLAEIVGRIQTSAISINSAFFFFFAGNQDLSQRTEQQAANLEETAA
ncbi:HAMP domain-containing protein, partial [Xanthomonas arboricola]|uniref:HAMP domain-containing protein n=1 Tax=Xanthomonas arboricola TaxID=56448 RepID=UPI000D421907